MTTSERKASDRVLAGFVDVAMGSLVDAPSIRPTEHIFVGSKAAWFEITDDLPQFDEHSS
jgi:hypothetical protein